jgi:hypothetical protein
MDYLTLYNQLHQAQLNLIDLISYERALCFSDALDQNYIKSNMELKLVQVKLGLEGCYSQVCSSLKATSGYQPLPQKATGELLKPPQHP